MDKYFCKDGKNLRYGYTTGSCATAATKAGVWMLITGKPKEQISIITPKGVKLELDVEDIKIKPNQVICAIRKDAGDDPDVTDGALIYSKVSFNDSCNITISGGKGVGKVTKKGLDQEVGNFAINSVPRKMIEENVRQVCDAFDCKMGIDVEISIPDGERLAKKTFNPRLGIVGGISVIGTTGIVEPMSEDAIIKTIELELRQKKELGDEYILLTPGNYGLDYVKNALNLDVEKAVQMSNFVGHTLSYCNKLGLKNILMVGHIGKLVKLAGGIYNTHSKYGDCRMEILASYGAAAGINSQSVKKILKSVSCDEAIDILISQNALRETMDMICEKIQDTIVRFSDSENVGAITFSKIHGLLGKTSRADELLKKISD